MVEAMCVGGEPNRVPRSDIDDERAKLQAEKAAYLARLEEASKRAAEQRKEEEGSLAEARK